MTDEEIRELLIKKRQRKRKQHARKRVIIIGILTVAVLAAAFLLGRVVGNKKYDKEIAGIVPVTEDVPLVNIAVPEVGSDSGKKYWEWFGFGSKVEWCGIFASWCENECGYVDAGKAPSFAMVGDGANWFKDRDRWLDAGSVPAAGDLIFFDWEQDGGLDHVGIVTAVTENEIFTIEGNSSDRCRQKRYAINSPVINGYGHIDADS